MSIELGTSKNYRGGNDLIFKMRSESNMQTRLELTPEDVAELVQALTAAGHIKPQVIEQEDLTVYGYCVVDRDGKPLRAFEGSTQQEAIDFAQQWTWDCEDAGIDWDYRVAAIVDQGGL